MKEKFVRKPVQKNIGEIGVEPTEKELSFAMATLGFVLKSREEYKMEVLGKLVEEYGEDEGKRQFELMVLSVDDSFSELEKKISDSSDDAKTFCMRK